MTVPTRLSGRQRPIGPARRRVFAVLTAAGLLSSLPGFVGAEVSGLSREGDLAAPTDTQGQAPDAASDPPGISYRMVDDPADPLRGISTVRLSVAISAPGAEACQISAEAIQQALMQPLTARGMAVVDGRDLAPRAAAAVPEVFLSITVLRDETGICGASVGLQLGVDTDVVLVHRNLDTPPGTVALSDGYVALRQSATMSLGVPPTFGGQVAAIVRELSTQLAGAIASANADRREAQGPPDASRGQENRP